MQLTTEWADSRLTALGEAAMITDALAMPPSGLCADASTVRPSQNATALAGSLLQGAACLPWIDVAANDLGDATKKIDAEVKKAA